MTVYVQSDEPLELALARFKSKVNKSGIISEYKGKTAFKSEAELRRERKYKRRFKSKNRG